MTIDRALPPLEISWADEAIALRIQVDQEGIARLVQLSARVAGAHGKAAGGDGEGAHPNTAASLPLVDVVSSATGRGRSGRRYVDSVVGSRLRYLDHAERIDGPWRELLVRLEDPETGLTAQVVYRLLGASCVFRSHVLLTNGGSVPVTIESVTSFLGSGLAGAQGTLDDVDIMFGENDWLAENRWHCRPFRDALPDVKRSAHGGDSRARFGLTGAGSWSSGTYLPMGAAVNRRTGHTWIWQIEHNGGWHWQVGEHSDRGSTSKRGGHALTGAYLALLGPTDAEHHWRLALKPGESFETVPAGLAISSEGFEATMAGLTNYRRAIRRPHEDHRRLPVIFNDYMNTLMGDPTTERLVPLIPAAAKAGAEYFCIDAGWYADIGERWWDTVGAWKPSPTRFPNGINEVLDLIRAEGMLPGLWLEPEVVGVRSPVAEQLPREAFFVRDGERVIVQGRYHLDLSHPAAVEHLDQVVDYLTGVLGIRYLKMDYNINVEPGTETGTLSAGAGMLAHNRAFLGWLEGVLDRHPDLTIENCASGGMRADYALLSRLQLQSTSDQQDLLRYAAIAAAAPMGIAPEQAAVWAYPQPEWSADEIAFTLCSALLGRIHLSGHIDRLDHAQSQLVADAIHVYKRIRPDLVSAVPFWPLGGLPGWTDPWVALGMRTGAAAYLTVSHRGPMRGALAREEQADPPRIVMPIPHLRGRQVDVNVLYPLPGGARADWTTARSELAVTLPRTPSACLIQVTPK